MVPKLNFAIGFTLALFGSWLVVITPIAWFAIPSRITASLIPLSGLISAVLGVRLAIKKKPLK